MSVAEKLRQNPLFAGAGEEAIREVARVAVAYQYAPGEVLLTQDRGGELLHLLTSGAVRISRLGSGQLERTVSELYAPDLVGETALLLGGERSATVTATMPTTTLALHRPHLEVIARRDPTLLWNLASILAQRVCDLNDELIAAGHSTDAALVHVVSGLYAQRLKAGLADAHILPLGYAELMERMATSRETVSRSLKRFQTRGLLSMNDGRLHLLQPNALVAFDPEGD